FSRDWSSDVCSSDLFTFLIGLHIVNCRKTAQPWNGIGKSVRRRSSLRSHLLSFTHSTSCALSALAAHSKHPLAGYLSNSPSVPRSEERRVGNERRSQ